MVGAGLPLEPALAGVWCHAVNDAEHLQLLLQVIAFLMILSGIYVFFGYVFITGGHRW